MQKNPSARFAILVIQKTCTVLQISGYVLLSVLMLLALTSRYIYREIQTNLSIVAGDLVNDKVMAASTTQKIPGNKLLLSFIDVAMVQKTFHLLQSFLNKVRQLLHRIRSKILSSYCALASLILRRKISVQDIPQQYRNSMVYTGVLSLVLLSYITVFITFDLGLYEGKHRLAINDISTSESQVVYADYESMESISFTNNAALLQEKTREIDPPMIKDEILNASSTDVGNNNEVVLESLLETIRNNASLDNISLINNEQQLSQLLDQLPQMTASLLESYAAVPDDASKNLLRSLLATSGSQDIEQYAIEKITTDNLDNSSRWLALLRDNGVHTTNVRRQLLDLMPSLDQTKQLRDAILAFAPDVVTRDEKQNVVDQLSMYLTHQQEGVRDAAVETLSKWVDGDRAYMLEQALLDESATVRRTALLAAFSSRIRSDTVKNRLLEIMRDDATTWGLRMDAHNALSGYELQGTEYDDFIYFHQRQSQHVNPGEARG